MSRDVLTVAHNHHMAAGSFLHMEPQVLAAGGVQGELVVLGVVAAHQDLEPVAGGEPQEIRRLLALVALLVVLQIALALQLCPDLFPQRIDITLSGRSLHAVIIAEIPGTPIEILLSIFLIVFIVVHKQICKRKPVVACYIIDVA